MSKPLTPEEKLELLELLQTQHRRKAENWLVNYQPYPKQLEFHARGADYRERLFMAGNQLGKTWAGAAELAYHVTGRYPKDWKGRRFPRATRWMVGSESAELTKNGIQRLLLGPPEKREEWGTGTIPKECIKDTSPRAGVPDAVSSIVVDHALGEASVIQFHSYDQGRTKWQADTVDGVWFDEEPPLDIYSEGLTRTNATQGLVFVTFTPLLGMSQVVKRFLVEKVAGSVVTSMTIEDAPHYTPEQRAKIIAAYPLHEREARANGIPIMGSGLVFPIAESTIRCEQFDIPTHWARLNALDFGWGHKAAWVALAHDRDADIVYVYDLWAENETTVAQQAMIITARGQHRVPTAWPHDGLQHDKGSGEVLKSQYEKFGINMTAERAQFEPLSDGRPGGHSVEAGISRMLERFEARSLRVFKHLEPWFTEFRLYHRKDGVIVKEDDDLMSATRYGVMMLRKGKTLIELGPVGTNRRATAPRLPTPEIYDTSVAW